MIKLLLSFWCHHLAFSFSECVRQFDGERITLVWELDAYYLKRGIDQELEAIGAQLAKAHPRLLALGEAGDEGKSAYFQKLQGADK